MSATEATDPPKGDAASDEPEVKPSESTASSSPASPESPSTAKGFSPLVTVVGFHHARGPEVESWFGVDADVDPAAVHGWSLLPFMALSDGAHA